jgi:GDP-L-fucose synthase
VYPPLDHALREDDAWSGPPHESYFGYGWMRRYLERMSELVARQSPVRIALVRPTAVYGRHDNFDPGTSRFVPALVRRAVERVDPYEVWGTGDETRDLLHVADLARGCLLALEKHARADPVNLGSGAPVRVRDVVRLVLNAADYSDARIVFNPDRPGTIPSKVVDCAKARDVLGFEPSVSLESGIRDAVQWYRATHVSTSAILHGH